MTELWRLAGWLVVLVVVGVLVFARPLDEQHVLETARMRVYPLSVPVRFSIEADEQQVELVTWVATPAAGVVDTRRTIPYALDVRVRDPGGAVVWSHQYWVRGRSAWQLDGLGRPVRGAHLVEDERELTSDRTTRIEVQGLAPRGGTLEVRTSFAPEGAEVLLAAFRKGNRSRLQTLRYAEDPDVRAEASGRLGPFDWQDLPTIWRTNLAGELWERLGALPPPGGGLVETVTLEAIADPMPFDDAASLGVPLWPGHVLTYNLEHDVTFEAELWSIDGARLDPAPAIVRVVHADGTTSERRSFGSSRLGPLELDEPVSAVQLALAPDAGGPRLVRARTRGPGLDRSFGDPPRLVDADGAQLVGPDLVATELVRVAPGLKAIVLAVGEGEVLRLSMRQRLGAVAPVPFGVAPRSPGARIWFEALDADGVRLGRWEHVLDPVISAYERFVEGDGPDVATSEPEVRYLRPPAGTRLVRFGSDEGTVDLSARVAAEPYHGREVRREYELPPGIPLEVRYEPVVVDAWEPRALSIEGARNNDPQIGAVADLDGELLRASRLVRLDAQVRLEPRPAAESSTVRSPLQIPGAFELVAEADRDGEISAGARTRLGTAPVAVNIPDSGRLVVDYRVAREQVGAEAVVRVEGREHRVPVVASAGQLKIHGLNPGVARVAVDIPGTFLARAEGQPAWQVRKVARLDLRELAVAMPAEPSSVVVWAYGGRGTSGRLSWAVEGPSSLGLVEEVAKSRGAEPLEPLEGDALPLSFQSEALVPYAPVVIRRNETGPATLRLALDGSGPVYVRVLASWAEPDGMAASHGRVGDR